jgi:hypothetical protein
MVKSRARERRYTRDFDLGFIRCSGEKESAVRSQEMEEKNIYTSVLSFFILTPDS